MDGWLGGSTWVFVAAHMARWLLFPPTRIGFGRQVCVQVYFVPRTGLAQTCKRTETL